MIAVWLESNLQVSRDGIAALLTHVRLPLERLQQQVCFGLFALCTAMQVLLAIAKLWTLKLHSMQRMQQFC